MSDWHDYKIIADVQNDYSYIQDDKCYYKMNENSHQSTPKFIKVISIAVNDSPEIRIVQCSISMSETFAKNHKHHIARQIPDES